MILEDYLIKTIMLLKLIKSITMTGMSLTLI